MIKEFFSLKMQYIYSVIGKRWNKCVKMRENRSLIKNPIYYAIEKIPQNFNSTVYYL